VEEVLESLVGAPSWRRLEATRLLAIQELAWKEASTIEHLVGELRNVVAKFDGVFARVVPVDVEMDAFMEWKPSQVYRKTSEVLLGKALFHQVLHDEESSRPLLDLLLSREGSAVGGLDRHRRSRARRADGCRVDRIEDRLADKEIPHPPPASV
jgi:hypothetical protein